MEQAHFTQKDRETLTKVETKLDRAIDDIKLLTQNFATKEEFGNVLLRVIELEQTTFTRDERTALLKKVEFLDTKVKIAIGMGIMITMAVIPMAIHIFNQSGVDYDKIKETTKSAINDYNLSLDKDK